MENKKLIRTLQIPICVKEIQHKWKNITLISSLRRNLFYWETCMSNFHITLAARPYGFTLSRGRATTTTKLLLHLPAQGGAQNSGCAALPVPLQCCHYSFTACPSSSRHNLNRGIAHDRKQWAWFVNSRRLCNFISVMGLYFKSPLLCSLCI